MRMNIMQLLLLSPSTQTEIYFLLGVSPHTFPVTPYHLKQDMNSESLTAAVFLKKGFISKKYHSRKKWFLKINYSFDNLRIKSFYIQIFSGRYFKSPFSFQIRENLNQKNSEYGRFSRSEQLDFRYKLFQKGNDVKFFKIIGKRSVSETVNPWNHPILRKILCRTFVSLLKSLILTIEEFYDASYSTISFYLQFMY